MSDEKRKELISTIEKLRGSNVICYLTSLRQNVPAQMGGDVVRVFFDHLLLLPSRPVDRLDIFLCSNGGSGTVPWRLTALFREFANKVSVLLPYRAYSAATLMALGADEIVMHPFGEMGPIDPTVSNDYNPVDSNTGRRLGISVEDVKAYVSFVKETVGIRHEDELVKAIEVLASKVHPLALGNVERFLSQSRLIARKLLRTHMPDKDNHTIEEIIENLASKLYFHGHPINRREAYDELGLKINLEPMPQLETAMWDLYKLYESEFNNLERFNPADKLMLKVWPTGNLPSGQPNPTIPAEITEDLSYAIVESEQLCSRYSAEKRYLLTAMTQNNEPLVREDTISEGWDHK